MMTKHIETIHKVSVDLLGVVEEEQIYQVLNEAMAKIIPDSYFLVTKLQPDDANFRIVKTPVLDKYFGLIEKLLGKNPYTMNFPIETLTELQIEIYENRKIHHFQDGLSGLANGLISKPVCKAIEKLMGISEVYAMAFCVDKKFFGGINIYTRRSSENKGVLSEEKKMLIEILTNQASAIIQKLRNLAIVKDNEAHLIKLNHTKDRFFSILAHDLISPFNGMLGLLDIIENEYYDYSDEERLKIIQSSHYSAQKAFNLLTDLLEWGRLQYGQLEIKKVSLNLKEIINENIELYKKNASKKEIMISNDVNPNISITVDKNSIFSVVRNLLNNAIKFTKSGGNIEFEAKQIINDIELSIKDNGVGMSQDTINKLFRIDENITMPGTNNEKGTGLGLTICNDLIIKNNWKMNIESQLGKGTTFKILIPIE